MAVHASHAALPYPIKGARFTIDVPFLDGDGDPTDPTSPDSEISKDNGNFADCLEEVAVPGTNRGGGMLTLTGEELDCSTAKVWLNATGPKATMITLQPRVLPTLESGTAQAGAAGTITLASGAAAYDLTGCFVKTTGGTGGGGTGGRNNQARKITAYNTSTKVATVVPNWETNPSSDTTYDILLPEGVTANMVKVLTPTVPGRTLDVSTGGEAGLDWANIGSPTTVVDLSGTLVKPRPIVSGTTTSSGTSTTLIDTSRTEADAEYWRRALVHITSGACIGQVRVVSAFNQTTDTISVTTPFTQSIASGVTYEILRGTGIAHIESIAADAITGSAIGDTARLEIAGAVWDELISDHIAPNSFGQRFQTLNYGTAQAGAGSTITLSASTASNSVDLYTGGLIVTTSGTGAGQSRYVSGYTPATRVANVSPAWSTNPDGTTVYVILPQGRVDLAHWLGSFPSALLNGGVRTAPILASTTTSSGSSTTLIDTARTESVVDYWKHAIIEITSGVCSGQIRRVTAFNETTDTLTVSPAFTATIASGVTYNILKVAGSVEADVVSTVSTTARDAIADSVWDEPLSGHVAVGTFGQVLQRQRTGTAQAGASSSITLDAGASAVDGFYATAIVAITGGTGAGQSRMISSYVGSTKVANVSPAWSTNPASGSEFQIIPMGRVDIAQVLGSFIASLVNGGIQTAPIVAGTTTSSGSTTTLIDTSRTESATDYWKGASVRVTSGACSGQTRTVTGFDTAADTLTVSPPFTATIASGVTYEILRAPNNPLNVLIPQLPQQAPPATPSHSEAMMYPYQLFRNKRTQNATEQAMWDDAGSTKIAKATISNDGTTTEKGEFGSGA